MIAQALNIYFIDQGNYAALKQSARDGDQLAIDIVDSIRSFMDQRSKRQSSNCMVCHKPMKADTLTFIVVWHDPEDGTGAATLTTWVCGDCIGHSNLSEYISAAVQHWLPGTVSVSMHTLH